MFERKWNKELEKQKQNEKPNLVSACFKVHATRVFFYSLLSIIDVNDLKKKQLLIIKIYFFLKIIYYLGGFAFYSTGSNC